MEQESPVQTSVILHPYVPSSSKSESSTSNSVIRLTVRIASINEFTEIGLQLRNVSVELVRVLREDKVISGIDAIEVVREIDTEIEKESLLARSGKSCRLSSKPLLLRLSLVPPYELSHDLSSNYHVSTKIHYISRTRGRFEVEFKHPVEFVSEEVGSSAGEREEEEEYDGYEELSISSNLDYPPPSISDDVSPPEIDEAAGTSLYSPPPPPIDSSTPPQYFSTVIPTTSIPPPYDA